MRSTKAEKHNIRDATIIVTGACGFIGSHLIEKLLVIGVKKIIAIDSLEYGKTGNIPTDKRIVFVKHKLGTDPIANLLPHFKKSNYLFHLAAEKHNQSKDSPEKVIMANITGMHQLLEAVQSCGVKKVVFSSSLYAYGRMSKPKFQETDVILPQTVYGMTKTSGEFLLAYFRRQYGLEYVALRYLFVYGPRQYSNLGYKSVIVSNFNKIIKGEEPTIYGDGKQTLDYIYIDDVVEATVKAMTTPLSGEVVNIGSGKEYDINYLTATMLKVSKSNLKPHSMSPDWTAGTYRVGDVSKAKKVLGFSARTTLEKGLATTFHWIKNNS